MNSQLQNKVIGTVGLGPDLLKGRTAGVKATCDKMLKCWGVAAEALTPFAGVSLFHWHFGSQRLRKTGSSFRKTLPGGACMPFGVNQITAEVPQYGGEAFAAAVLR